MILVKILNRTNWSEDVKKMLLTQFRSQIMNMLTKSFHFEKDNNEFEENIKNPQNKLWRSKRRMKKLHQLF